MLSIGEFSNAVKLSVKTIRYYEDQELITPAKKDATTGYRYYNSDNFERAETIILLKNMGFTIKEIRNILKECKEEEDLRLFIDKKLVDIKYNLQNLNKIKKSLESHKTRIEKMATYNTQISIIDFELKKYASESVIGQYHKIGEGFNKLYKKFGRYITGKPYAFYHDAEYKETEANMEAVVELVPERSAKLKEVKTFQKQKAVCLVHKGRYGTQGSSYFKLFNYCKENDLKTDGPIIEHYIKGPGIIFKGNPDMYLTECIMLIKE